MHPEKNSSYLFIPKSQAQPFDRFRCRSIIVCDKTAPTLHGVSSGVMTSLTSHVQNDGRRDDSLVLARDRVACLTVEC